MNPSALPFHPMPLSLTADAVSGGDHAMEPVPSIESAELLTHDGYSDSAVPNGTGN